MQKTSASSKNATNVTPTICSPVGEMPNPAHGVTRPKPRIIPTARGRGLAGAVYGRGGTGLRAGRTRPSPVASTAHASPAPAMAPPARGLPRRPLVVGLDGLRRTEHLRLTQRSQCWMPTFDTWRVNNLSGRCG